MALMKIIVILIYINSNTAQETDKCENMFETKVFTALSYFSYVCNHSETLKNYIPISCEPHNIGKMIVLSVCENVNNLSLSWNVTQYTIAERDKGNCGKMLKIEVCATALFSTFRCNNCTTMSITIPANCDRNMNTVEVMILLATCEHVNNQSTIWDVTQNNPTASSAIQSSMNSRNNTTIEKPMTSAVTINSATLSSDTVPNSTTTPSVSPNLDVTTTSSATQSNLNSGNNTTIGIAIGVSLAIIFIIGFLMAVLILYSKRSKQQKDDCKGDHIHDNHTGNQEIAFPWKGTSPELCEKNNHNNNHKYKDINNVPMNSLKTSYDYIDVPDPEGKYESPSSIVVKKTNGVVDNNVSRKLSNASNKNGINYSVLHAKENRLDNLSVKSKHSSFGEDYAVLDPNETGFNRSGKSDALPNESYVVLDPIFTGYDRSHAGNGYELAKSITTEIENDSFEQSIEDTYTGNFGQNENDYNMTNQKGKCYTKENIYNHSVDIVYDTANQKRKEDTPDNTYDHFFGQKTADDYDMLKS